MAPSVEEAIGGSYEGSLPLSARLSGRSVPPEGEALRVSDEDTRGLEGLTTEEAERRLSAEGPNELPSAKPRTWLAIALDVVREPMLLLLVCGRFRQLPSRRAAGTA